MTTSTTPRSFENAMFGGIDSVLAHYKGWIESFSLRNHDPSRCTLNAQDRAQEALLVVLRCWRKQINCLDVANFDILVKTAIRRAFLSMTGKEYSVSRGRFNIAFISELITDPTASTDAYESLVDREEVGQYQLNEVVHELEEHIDDPTLQNTFRHIVAEEAYDALHPNTLTSERKRQLAFALQVSEDVVVHHVTAIHFTLNGFRGNFRS